MIRISCVFFSFLYIFLFVFHTWTIFICLLPLRFLFTLKQGFAEQNRTEDALALGVHKANQIIISVIKQCML